jgi:hypothetical protein
MTNATSLPTVLSLQNVTAIVYADRVEWSKDGQVYAIRQHSGKQQQLKELRACGYTR